VANASGESVEKYKERSRSDSERDSDWGPRWAVRETEGGDDWMREDI
jgi:hypothetical protein